ncbi:hypothetical protein [Nocardia sp. NPDC049707]|uniref:hypothetical protein n=1 Tax=Nocardia sp. NPDC049707 TaxID=3154735 RepID=UPI00341B52B0
MQAEGVHTARGKIWRWNRKRATGIVESMTGGQIWFGLDSLRGRNFDEINIGDIVDVDYEFAQQDSHDRRAVLINWVEA